MNPEIRELIVGVAWPVVALIAMLLYWLPITMFIRRLKAVKYKDIELTAQEIESATNDLLAEADELIADFGPAEQAVMKKVFTSRRALKVRDIFPEFVRASEEHDLLRRLRDAQLIRPLEGGRFDIEKYIEIKPFGRLLLKHRRDKLLGSS